MINLLMIKMTDLEFLLPLHFIGQDGTDVILQLVWDSRVNHDRSQQ